MNSIAKDCLPQFYGSALSLGIFGLWFGVEYENVQMLPQISFLTLTNAT